MKAVSKKWSQRKRMQKQKMLLGFCLLSGVAAHAGLPNCEFHVNTYTAGDQYSSEVAMDADGDMVVVWEGAGTQDSWGIYAQRYSKTGAAVGAQFLVNTVTAGNQQAPSIAMDDDGDFVVSWTGEDYSGSNVCVQRFNNMGVMQGGEVVVASTPNGGGESRVAMSSTGNFIVAWVNSELINSSMVPLLKGQRYNAAGVPQGSETVLITLDNADSFGLAMDAAGNFVIVYPGLAQRFDAQATPQGSVIETGLGFAASVDMDASGNFVITATQFEADGDSYGIQVIKYNNSGTALTDILVANTFATDRQSFSSVSANNDGSFVVVWQSYGQDGSGSGIYGQKFTSAGTKSGAEFRVNTYTANDQAFPGTFGNNIATDNNGNMAIVWGSSDQEGAGNSGIYAKRLNANGTCYTYIAPPANTAPVITSNLGGATASLHLLENEAAVTTVQATDADNNAISYSISGGADAADFAINSTTGELTFVTAPLYATPQDADHNNTYLVTVKAIDNGTGNLFDEQTITVSVIAPLAASPLSFNGSNQYVVVPANPAQEFTTGTVEMSIKPDWNPGSHNFANLGLIGERSPFGTRYSIHILNALNGIGIWNGIGWQYIMHNFIKGKWAHIACVMTTDGAKFYVDGSFIGETTNGINTSISDVDIAIGSSLPGLGDELFEGEINEVRIWNTARTEEEIAANMSAEINPLSNGLVGYYPIMDSITGDVNSVLQELKDSSATGATGKLYNYWVKPAAITVTDVQKTGECAGDYSSVSYTSDQSFNPGNVFTIELSDATGSFATPIAIGSYEGTSLGAFIGHFPSHLAESDNYRVRVSSTFPAIVGTESVPFTLHNRPEAPLLSGPSSANAFNTYKYTLPATAGSTYKWSVPATYSAGGDTAYVTWYPSDVKQPVEVYEISQFGCSGDTARKLVRVFNHEGDNVSVSTLTPCPGSQFTVTAHVSGAFNRAFNQFKVELSDKYGSFNQPKEIGSVKVKYVGFDTVLTIGITMPRGVANGNYRVRVVSEAAHYTSPDNQQDIVINKPTMGADKVVFKCQNSTIDLTALFNTTDLQTAWTTATPSAVMEQGIYTLVVTNANGCTDEVAVEVKNYPQPQLGNDTTIAISKGSFIDLTTLFDTNGFDTKWNTPTPDHVSTGTYRLYAGRYGCRDTVAVKVVRQTNIVNRAAIEQKSAPVTDARLEVSVYPNPSRSGATLQVSATAKGYSVTISDLSGKEVWKSFPVNTPVLTLPVERLAPGIYSVTINNGTEVKTLKLIRE